MIRVSRLLPVRVGSVLIACVLSGALCGAASGQSLVGTTFAAGGTSVDLLVIDPATGATQRYMTVSVPAGRDVYQLGALPDCRLAGTVYRAVSTAPNFASQLMRIDTFTGTATTINFSAPLDTMYVEALDYSPRHGALLLSFTALNSFGTNRLALVDPVTGAVSATSGALSPPDIDTIISGPTSDISFDLNGASPRVRQLSTMFPTPAFTSFATPPTRPNWYDGAMHPTTGEVIFTFPVSGTSIGSQLARLVGNDYTLGAVIGGGITLRGLAWANLPPLFPEPIAGEAGIRVCPGGTTTLTSTAVGTAPAEQWEIEDAQAPSGFRALVDGVLSINGTPVATVSGSASRTLTLDLAGYGAALGAANFRCVASNACATTASPPALVRVCPGDVNCDGNVDAD